MKSKSVEYDSGIKWITSSVFVNCCFRSVQVLFICFVYCRINWKEWSFTRSRSQFCWSLSLFVDSTSSSIQRCHIHCTRYRQYTWNIVHFESEAETLTLTNRTFWRWSRSLYCLYLQKTKSFWGSFMWHGYTPLTVSHLLTKSRTKMSFDFQIF